jgi:hypothetical protein
MLLYCKTITPRLTYIAGFIGKEISGQAMAITSNAVEFSSYEGPRMNYSDDRITADELWVKPHSLLFEENIKPQQITCTVWLGKKIFFETKGDIPFDIFAASFYLLSRYEEYLPHEKDMYGRYAHGNSLAFKEGFLNQPLVNGWILDLKALLKTKFPAHLPATNGIPFTFLPTYDIDMAWSYRHKGGWRTAGGLLASLLKGKLKDIAERIKVWRGKQRDPYDVYGWMNQLHEKYKVRPYYFFLLADKTSKYDKNIPPDSRSMKDLIHDHAIRYPIGIHPSWQSGDNPSILKKEIHSLAAITGNNVRSSRQHYIRFTLPETFRRLLENGIQFDFSMGYGSINGFRASLSSPYYWYDLPAEKETALLLFPYCFMDANSFYEQKLTPEQALEEMGHYYNMVKKVNGTFIMIWHNSFLSTDPLFTGWRDVYEKFIKEMVV